MKSVDRIEILVLVENKSDTLSTIPASTTSTDFQPELASLKKNGLTAHAGHTLDLFIRITISSLPRPSKSFFGLNIFYLVF
jgi:hypothetical protein